MLDLANDIRSLSDLGIQRGLADVTAGGTKPAAQVFNRLRHKHGISRCHREEHGDRTPRDANGSEPCRLRAWPSIVLDTTRLRR